MSAVRQSLSILNILDRGLTISRTSLFRQNLGISSFLTRRVNTTNTQAENKAQSSSGSGSEAGESKIDGNGHGQAQQSSLEDELRAQLSKVCTESASLRAKCQEYEDKYKRALADSENLRTRLTKQIQDQKLYAIQGFCKDLTDIEDILSLAIDSVPKAEVESNKYLKELYQGLTMTEAQLIQVFKRHGLTQINPINQKFNPNEHEAVMQKEEEGKESGTVIFVSKLGYKLHERVIRPAVVGVAK